MRTAIPIFAVRKRSTPAFTLVELLVVIGIIAILIALLMPSLSGARQMAQRTACAAKLQQILLAAQTHAIDHSGYYPLVGVLPGWMPAHFQDPYSTKYDYFANNDWLISRMPPPITMSLAKYMSYPKILDSGDNNVLGQEETDPHGFIRYFLCPSQAASTDEIIQLPALYVAANVDLPGDFDAYTEAQSYNFNEALCGWGVQDNFNRLKGKQSLVHQPAMTMFAADGLMGSIYEGRIPWPPGVGMATLYNIALYPPITMADALTGNGKAGDPENFDKLRHRGKINIGFCDGHVETRSITPNDLANVFLMAP